MKRQNLILTSVVPPKFACTITDSRLTIMYLLFTVIAATTLAIASGEECIHLNDVFGGAGGRLVEENGATEGAISSTILGDLTNVGDSELWSDSPLYLNELGGEIVGYSSGICIALPKSSMHQELQCSGVLKFVDMHDHEAEGERRVEAEEPHDDSHEEEEGEVVNSITYSGLTPLELDDFPATLAITGGTGCYEGVSGTLHLMAHNEDFDHYDYELHSFIDPHDIDGMILEALERQGAGRRFLRRGNN